MFGLMRKRTHQDLLHAAAAGHDEALEAVTKHYQTLVDAEYKRVLGLCRSQLHRWAADGFYELFTQGPNALTGMKLRGMFGEAEKMLSPERLKL